MLNRVPVKGTVTVANPPDVPPAPMPSSTARSASLTNVDVIDASLRVGCNVPQEGSIDQASYELPAVQSGELLKVFGGPMKLHVPAGGCLQFVGTAQAPSVGPAAVEVRGSITGYLSDARVR